LTGKKTASKSLAPPAKTGAAKSGATTWWRPTHVAQKEDVVMRTQFDFAPLYRSSVGFDRVFDLLENATRGQAAENWPPYDISKTGDDAYRITMAVAGFAMDDLNVVAEPNLLVVAGEKKVEQFGEVLHRGIANRSFRQRFELADHMKVNGAHLADGLLTIELQREIPEEMKPRQVAINTVSASKPEKIGDQRQAA
jgi:molecular chaperone IbpA